MNDEEVEARATLIALLPDKSQLRLQQERDFITLLIGSEPAAAGNLALRWWAEPAQGNHWLLRTVLQGIRTREPEQALRILEALGEDERRTALRNWIASLDYAAETETLLVLLQRVAQLPWQSEKKTVYDRKIPGVLEEVYARIGYLEPTIRQELVRVLVTAIEALPESERRSELLARIASESGV